MPLTNLQTRILVAIVGIPLILVVSIAGGIWFFLFVALVSALALHEFYALGRIKGAQPQTATGLVLGFLVNGVFLYSTFQMAILRMADAHGLSLPMPSTTQLFLILFLLFLPLMLLIELFRNRGSALLNLAVTIFGVVYVSLFLGALVGIRGLFNPTDFPVSGHFNLLGPDVPPEVVGTIDRWGGATVISLFATIWICDTAAFSAGRKLGRHKLFPRVSPNKTWEGAIAGLVFAIATFLAAREIVLPYMRMIDALVCGAIVGVFGQLGDLAESVLKRDAGVKDSSTLIPGHGGVLDRFDSLMFVSPLIFFYLDFIVF